MSATLEDLEAANSALEDQVTDQKETIEWQKERIEDLERIEVKLRGALDTVLTDTTYTIERAL